MPTNLLRAPSGDDTLIIGLALAGLIFAAACKATEYLMFGAILFDVGPWAFLGIPCSIWIFQRDRRTIIAALLVGFLTAGALQIALRLPDLPIITGIGPARSSSWSSSSSFVDRRGGKRALSYAQVSWRRSLS